MKKVYFLFALACALFAGAMASNLNAEGSSYGSPQGGYYLWHQMGGSGRWITVDQVGCVSHITSHPNDYVSGYDPGDLTGCGVVY